MNPKRIKTLVGLELGGRRLTAVELQRVGSRFEVKRRASGALSLDPLTAAPELAGREIANILSQGGIRATHCLVCLPLGQLLVHQIDIPELDEADRLEYIALETERIFPFAPEDLSITESTFTEADGRTRATLAAVSLSHITALEKVMRHAKLRMVSVTLGSAALVSGEGQHAEGAIIRNEAGIELLIAGGGGLMVLRPLGELAGAGDRESELDAEALVRECRISLGRLPRPVRDALGTIRVFGPEAAGTALVGALERDMKAMGVNLTRAGVADDATIGALPTENPAAVTVAAAEWLRAGKSRLEFLPPRESRMKAFSKQFLVRAGIWKIAGAAACLLVLVLLAFVWQEWRLGSLNSQWAALEPQFNELDAYQQKINKYEPWYDDKAGTLQIMAKLTEAFPERGDVWLTSFQIKEQNEIQCNGNGLSTPAIRKVYSSLIDVPGVKSAELTRMNGANPVNFSMKYLWNPNARANDGR